MLAAIMAGGVGTLLVLALPAYELRAIDWEFIVDIMQWFQLCYRQSLDSYDMNSLQQAEGKFEEIKMGIDDTKAKKKDTSGNTST